MHDWLGGYFKDLPSARASFYGLQQTGASLSLRERVTWETTSGETKRAEALAVYEITDGLIRHVWYFPAT